MRSSFPVPYHSSSPPPPPTSPTPFPAAPYGTLGGFFADAFLLASLSASSYFISAFFYSSNFSLYSASRLSLSSFFFLSSSFSSRLMAFAI